MIYMSNEQNNQILLNISLLTISCTR